MDLAKGSTVPGSAARGRLHQPHLTQSLHEWRQSAVHCEVLAVDQCTERQCLEEVDEEFVDV